MSNRRLRGASKLSLAAALALGVLAGPAAASLHTEPHPISPEELTTGPFTQLLGNSGFENGSASPAPWVPTAGVIDSSNGEAAHSGIWKAWMDGYGTVHTDTLYQQVTIPPTATIATLSFFLHIDTAETTKTTPFDTLSVQIRNTSDMLLATLATYSNLNAAAGYAQKSFNLLAYRGQTIRIYFVAIEDSTRQTSFVIDDVTVNVQ
jgi:kumamolisin